MAYNTGNPLGSKDPRDLSDNATNFDKFSVGTEPMYMDRFGVLKLSIEGQQQAFQAAQEGREEQFQASLLATGFEDIGNYAAGLTITARNQVFARNGVYYSASAELVLPYTLTGNWAAEGPNFILRADAPLRSQLAGTGGSEMVGDGSGTVSTSLRAVETGVSGVAARASALEALVYVNATEASAGRDFGLTDLYKLVRFTAAGLKNFTLPAQAAVTWPTNSEFKIFNDTATTLTVAASAGVAIKVAYGGSMTIPAGGFAWLKRLAADTWLLVSRAPTTTSKIFANVKAWGDSITVGVGASAPRFAYIARETELIRTPITNGAVSGACTWDQAIPIMSTGTVAVNEAAQLMIGTNDARLYGSTTNNLDNFKKSHAALLVWLAIPAVGKVLANDASVTYAGAWTPATAYGGTWVRRTEGTGDTVTFTFTGPTVYICASRFVSFTSSATVSVDGVQVGTTTGSGYSAVTQNGVNFGPTLHRFTGFGSGTHTVVIRTVATSAAAPFFFDWFAVPASFNRPVNVINVPKQIGLATDATIAAYSAAMLDNVTTFNSDGGKFAFGDVMAVISTATDLNPDSHPNDAGHAKIAQVAANSFAVMATL